MAGERAKENDTLRAACVACGVELSVELLRGLTVGAGRERRIVAVCVPCLDGGWTVDAPAAETGADDEAASDADTTAADPASDSH